MNENDIIHNAIIGGVFLFISYLLLLIGSIIIFNKQKNKVSILLLLGIILMILFSSSSILVPFLLRNSIEKIVATQGILRILSSISQFIFAIGIFLFSLKLIKK